MSRLGYRWIPTGTRRTYMNLPAIGALIPFEHAVYRVVEINEIPEVDWTPEEIACVTRNPKAIPRHMIIRPIRRDDRDKDLHFRVGGRHYYRSWYVYEDEHYPICAYCLEPLPCREQMAARVSFAAIERMGWFEKARVCPSCSEPVTAKQKSKTWPENLEIPGGPPVTFHLRLKCLGQARMYDERWTKETGQESALDAPPSSLFEGGGDRG